MKTVKPVLAISMALVVAASACGSRQDVAVGDDSRSEGTEQPAAYVTIPALPKTETQYVSGTMHRTPEDDDLDPPLSLVDSLSARFEVALVAEVTEVRVVVPNRAPDEAPYGALVTVYANVSETLVGDTKVGSVVYAYVGSQRLPDERGDTASVLWAHQPEVGDKILLLGTLPEAEFDVPNKQLISPLNTSGVSVIKGDSVFAPGEQPVKLEDVRKRLQETATGKR